MPSSRRESSFSYKHTPTSLSETKKLLPGVLQRTIIKGENECSEMNSPTNIDSNGKKIGGASTRWRKICSECMIECHLFNEEIVATKPVL